MACALARTSPALAPAIGPVSTGACARQQSTWPATIGQSDGAGSPRGSIVSVTPGRATAGLREWQHRQLLSAVRSSTIRKSFQWLPASWQVCSRAAILVEGGSKGAGKEKFLVRAGLGSEAMGDGSGSALSTGLHPITSEEQLDEILAEAEEKGVHVVIDWMAQWCRKCIYLKPKIEKIANEFPSMRFCMVDVNAVPSSLVKRANVASMPTIQLWKDSKWQAEVVGGHKPALVLEEVREMLNQATSS